MLYPDFNASLTRLPLAQLRAKGVKVLAFDLDHTLAQGRTRRVSPEFVAYLQDLSRSGFRLLLASNAPGAVADQVAGSLKIPAVPATLWSRKPFPSYYRRLLAAAGHPPREVAMVGDRIINDIVAANLAGLTTVKVDPLGRWVSPIQRLYDRLAARRNYISR